MPSPEIFGGLHLGENPSDLIRIAHPPKGWGKTQPWRDEDKIEPDSDDVMGF
jgi:hypothetical protein